MKLWLKTGLIEHSQDSRQLSTPSSSYLAFTSVGCLSEKANTRRQPGPTQENCVRAGRPIKHIGP